MNFLKRLFGHQTPTPEGTWSIVKAVNQATGEASVIRLMKVKPSSAELLSTAIEITWPYQSTGNFPETSENAQMLEFERAIDDLTTENGHTEMVQVSTGGGQKVWLLYTADQERFMSGFNERLSGHPKYPLVIRFYEDPRWNIWQETVDTIAEKQA